ncbi:MULTISPECIES: hypothetical protein [Moraxella]|uniref:Uncharacterized protein n=1 Tax=Moraxella catarrhalis TaxID=480 RepID=A0A198UZU7_MORCA|nr:hypothetical protein [Moraxella catarrhalis]EGE18795.1 hypothetical protein E9U_08168 [Moraxella catarrhalis BC8]EGE22583.1 hypothetical protein E9W_09177 [Moraxella catarrhalis CO72]EGE24904.1 hypothetical protein EA1_06466 [Moraxella catarrhalis O35E]MPW71631.1 hypothetical protein [Moraxella catarrhalis]MPW73072.1 hypothetical protein [Moraxella catarrhalis]
MDGWIIWAYLALNVLILIQNFTQKTRIRKLEDALFVYKKQEWLEYAQSQANLPQVKAIKAIRAKFPEISFRQAVQLYVMVSPPKNHS